MAFKELNEGYQYYLKIKNNFDKHIHETPSNKFLQIGSRIERLRSEEIKHYISAVVLFQGMMETIINNESPSAKGFANKWREKLNINESDHCFFNSYNCHFYKKLRIPIIHPETKNGSVPSLEILQFEAIYKGMKNGWDAFKKLYNTLDKPHDSNSWEIMCNAYRLPIYIDFEIIDTSKISGLFFKKHLDNMNKKLKK